MLVLKGKRQRIDVLAFSPSGRELLSAGNGSWLDLWRFDSSPNPDRQFDSGGGYPPLACARFIDDGKAILAASGYDGIRIHPLSPKSRFRSAVLPELLTPTSLAISPDETRVVGYGFFRRNRMAGVHG
jgi:WD40 repeat protein